VNTIRRRTLVLAAALAFLGPAVRSEQSQKAARPAQEDRIKKLDERADAVEKAASSAVLEKASPVSQCTISPLGSRCSWL
jgi:hypothetical protein